MKETPSDIVAEALDEALPDALILEEIRRELHRRMSPIGTVSVLIDSTTMSMPVDVKLTLVEKALYEERHGSVFPTGCRVDVALGDTQTTGLGLLRPAYCFARVFFDVECKRTRFDFMSTIYRFSDEEEQGQH